MGEIRELSGEQKGLCRGLRRVLEEIEGVLVRGIDAEEVDHSKTIQLDASANQASDDFLKVG